jgi:hypothetical protein
VAASRDTQLDAVALIQAHIDRDNTAASVILANCDPLPTANFLAWLVGSMLGGLAERENMDPVTLLRGVAELRASVLEGGE